VLCYTCSFIINDIIYSDFMRLLSCLIWTDVMCCNVMWCCGNSGVSALHSLNEHVVHRDIKSFNFLVDDQLNAKLADLELGFDDDDDTKSKQDNEALFQEDFLFNWLAPEVLQSTIYTQASDIYSLSLVLWEIMSGEFPFFENDIINQLRPMKEQIIGGRRPDFTDKGLPICCAAYEQIVTLGWSMDPLVRPSAASLVAALNKIWRTSGNSRLEILGDSRRVSSVLSSYLLSMSPAVDQSLKRTESSSIVSKESIPGPRSGFQRNLFLDDEEKNNTAEEVMASYQHLAPLRDLYLAIESDPIWKIARSSTDPLIIISGKAPHIFMLMSTKFESLTGLREKNCFGLCFEDFVTSPRHIVDKEGSNQKILSDFYVSLKLNKSAHMVLDFLTSSDEELPLSVYAMPIYSKDSVEYDNMTSVDMTHSLDSISIRDIDHFDFSAESMNADKDALYYILDMSYLEPLNKVAASSFVRTFSTSSMASKLSGLFKSRPVSSTPSRHMSMQNQNQSRSSSFSIVNRNSEISNMMRTSYSSGNLNGLRDSFLSGDLASVTSSDLI
jgi:hypothetical protein